MVPTSASFLSISATTRSLSYLQGPYPHPHLQGPCLSCRVLIHIRNYKVLVLSAGFLSTSTSASVKSFSYLQGPYPHPHPHLQSPYLHPYSQSLILRSNIDCSPFTMKQFSCKYISIISSLNVPVLFARWDEHVRKNALKLMKRVKVCYLLCEMFIQGIK